MSRESPKRDQFGAPVDPMRLVIAFGRKRWIIASGAILGAIAGVGLSKAVVPPVFEARSVIECDRCSRLGFVQRAHDRRKYTQSDIEPTRIDAPRMQAHVFFVP